MSATPTFTKEEFMAELCRFRELFGTKTFWKRPQVERKSAISGLMQVYFYLDPSVEIDHLSVALQAAITEYTVRELLMLKHGMAVGA